jgi:hypothetical protein
VATKFKGAISPLRLTFSARDQYILTQQLQGYRLSYAMFWGHIESLGQLQSYAFTKELNFKLLILGTERILSDWDYPFTSIVHHN